MRRKISISFPFVLLLALSAGVSRSSQHSAEPSPHKPAKTFNGAGGRVALDPYGGLAEAPSSRGATGAFRVEKVGNRWTFVTPAGNAFWMFAVFNVALDARTDDQGKSYSNRVIAKYGNVENWGSQIAARLTAWGFNTAAEYSDWRVWKKIPTVHILNTAANCLTNRWNLAPAPVKELIRGADPAVYRGWRGGSTPDVFDPHFATYVEETLARDIPGIRAMYGSPYLLGIATDDRDYLFGFGPGVEIQAYSPHPHLGWIVLVGNPYGTTGSGTTQPGAMVYSKLALRDMLKASYGTIEALNKAWGSKYTHWDSAGGWGTGTGFLDEKGLNPWVGRDFNGLKDAHPKVRADLDDYLYLFAKRYFSVMAAAIRKFAGSKHLVFGPATLNSDGLTRRQILRAAGEEMDVIQASIESQAALDLTFQYTGDRPIVTWEGFVANPDSAFFRYPQPTATWTAATQEKRGQTYAERIKARFHFTTRSGVNPIAGIKYWEFHDNWAEKNNWGLVSLSDNAYDGKEAVRAPGTDPWGYTTGGEERDYGDFLGVVRAANLAILQALVAERRLQKPSR